MSLKRLVAVIGISVLLVATGCSGEDSTLPPGPDAGTGSETTSTAEDTTPTTGSTTTEASTTATTRSERQPAEATQVVIDWWQLSYDTS